MRWACRATRVVALVALVALVVAAAGCARTSSATAPPPSSTATPTTAPPPRTPPVPDPCGVVLSAGVNVSGAAGTCAVTAVLGVSFAIVLDPGFNWQDPTSDSAAVTVSAITRHPSGRLDATLTTEQVGRAAVSATGGILCPPGQPCPALARLWRLQVTVVP